MMANETSKSGSKFDLSQPLPAGAGAFSQQMRGMMDGQPKDEATVDKALEGVVDHIAAGLYSLASMLVGEGEDSIRLVETAIATAEVSSCTDPEMGRRSGRRALVRAALQLLAERDAASLAAPVGLTPVATCIEDDDLDAAGVSREELEGIMAGPNRGCVRSWLESMPIASRTIFVLRAVAGCTAHETAGLLASYGGPQAAGWSAEAVRELFRQALCSLASQLIQAGIRS